MRGVVRAATGKLQPGESQYGQRPERRCNLCIDQSVQHSRHSFAPTKYDVWNRALTSARPARLNAMSGRSREHCSVDYDDALCY